MVKTTNYKAWAAFGGSLVTAVVASPVIPVDSKAHIVLTILSTILTTYTTWQVPYMKASEPIPNDRPEVSK